MGSATKHALRTLKGEVDRTADASLETGAQLFDAVDVIVQQPQLRSVLADASADAAAKRGLVERVFGRTDARVVSLLTSAAAQRWSNEAEFALGMQELGVRAVSQFSGSHETIRHELQGFVDTVSKYPDLELTLGSKLSSDADGKRRLLDRVFGGKLSEATMTILRHLIALPAGRRIRRLVTWAQDIVADQANRQVATVTVAKPIDEAQLQRLQSGLARHFGRPVALAQVVDPAVIGGLRVQFGDDVIDDTVQSKLSHLQRQFA